MLVWMLMRETNPATGEGTHEKISWTASLGHIVRAYGMKRLRAIFVANFLFQAGVTFLATFFSVYLIARFAFDQVAIGYYIGYMGICLVLVQALVLPVVSRHLDGAAMLRISLLTGSAAIFAYYIPNTVVGLVVVGALVALTNGLSMAGLPSLVSSRTPARIQGEILGINASVQALAQAVPPILAGFLAAEIAPVAPVYIAGATIGLAWVVFALFVRSEK
jgi:predicted MFS family arabinose efflux permease